MRIFALVAFSVLNVTDMASTWVGLRIGLSEVNPVASALLACSGEGAIFLFKIVASLLAAAMTVKAGRRYERVWLGLHSGNLLLAIVVFSNLAEIAAV